MTSRTCILAYIAVIVHDFNDADADDMMKMMRMEMHLAFGALGARLLTS